MSRRYRGEFTKFGVVLYIEFTQTTTPSIFLTIKVPKNCHPSKGGEPPTNTHFHAPRDDTSSLTLFHNRQRIKGT